MTDPKRSNDANTQPGRPTSRPTRRVELNTSADQGNDPNLDGDCRTQAGSRSVSAPSPHGQRRSYATQARTQTLRDNLSERDLAIIQTIGMVQVATSDQLERLHFDDLKESSRTRQRNAVLSRLVRVGALIRLPRRIGGVRAGSAGYIFALDLLGQRLLERRRVRTPPAASWPYLNHALAVTELYVTTSEAEQDGRLDFVRFIGEPQCWSLIEGDTTLRPDAIVSVKPDKCDWTDHWAVEVDLGSERPVRLRSKLMTYWEAYQSGSTLHGTSTFPKVLLTVPTEKRLEEALRVIERLPADAAELIVVVLHDQAVDLLVSGGPT